MAAKKEKETKKAVPTTDSFDKISLITEKLNKKYKCNLVKTGKDIPTTVKVPFGEPSLDYVYSGGIPVNRVIEKIGKEYSFKTVESIKALRAFQRFCFSCLNPSLEVVWERDKKGIPQLVSAKCSCCKTPKATVQIFLDIEGTTDEEFLKSFGIDTNGVLYARIELPSQASNIAEAYMRLQDIGLIVIDSVGAMSSDQEVEKSMDEIGMNRGAMTLNAITRKFTAAINYNTNRANGVSPTTVMVINQTYANISLYGGGGQIAQGGRGLRHAKSISTSNRMVETVVDEDTKALLGKHVIISNTKNKTGVPERKAEFYINLDPDDEELRYCETDVLQQYVDFSISLGYIEKSGSWYSYEGKKWQGTSKIKKDFPKELKAKVDEFIYGGASDG